MPTHPSIKQKSLRRVKAGVRRFLDNMADEMKHIILSDEAAEREAAKISASSRRNEIASLPEEIVEDIQRTQSLRETEAANLALWRDQIENVRKDRDERKQYFDTLLSDSEKRFAQMLTQAQAQLAGEEPPESSIERKLDDTEPDNEAPKKKPGQAAAPIDYELPTVEHLYVTEIDESGIVTPETLADQKKALQTTFDNFAVDAFVYDAVVGPRVTQFRVKPGIGVRVESIVALQKNISLALSQPNVRIQAPIPGEPYVGIEIGNGNTLPIRFHTALESTSWANSNAVIPLAMGMDLQGKVVVADLAKAPHLLIAGATGSGKSVCMSNLILSMLYTFTPDELELILIDPKKVEFGLYKKIPHLIHPVVSDAKKAVQVLKWIVAEMESRYETLAEKQVRNIASYNAKAEREGFNKIPFLVLIIDELADLMMTSKGEAEASLARIAQLSRAVGIHTIVATQRPSVDVITGVIKANYPTRVAFQVSSNVDSRTIIDSNGAESLIGKGDMLFNPPGIARLLRIQSPLLEDDEIQSVTEFLAPEGSKRRKARVDLKTVPETAGLAGIGGSIDANDDQVLLREALKIVAETQRASTSFLQRRLRIGYNRAAGLIEEMEDRLHIGPQMGSTPREVFITQEEVSSFGRQSVEED